jgi:MFS family permease
MVWLLVIPGAILIVRNTPEERGLYPDGDPHPPPGEPHVTAGSGAPDKRRVLTSLTFWMLALPLATSPFVITALIFHQTSIFAEQGLSPAAAAAVFVPYAIASAACSLGAGVFIDRFGPKAAFLGNMVVMSATILFILFVVRSPATATVYGLMLGATGGTAQVIGGVTWAHFYGRQGLGRIQGSATMVGISAAAIGPLPLALAEGATESFQFGIASMLVLPVVASIAVWRARPVPYSERVMER